MIARNAGKGPHLAHNRTVKTDHTRLLKQEGQQAGCITVTEEDLRVPAEQGSVQLVQDPLGTVTASNHENRANLRIGKHAFHLFGAFPVSSRQEPFSPIEKIGPPSDPKALGLEEADSSLEGLPLEGARGRDQSHPVPSPQQGRPFKRSLRSRAQPYSPPCQ